MWKSAPLVMLLVVLLTGGCAGTGSQTAAVIGVHDFPTGLDSGAMFFVRDGKLWPASRPWGKNVGPRAVLAALFAGPSAQERAAGVRTAIPPGVRLLGASYSDSLTSEVVTVNLSSGFARPGSDRSLALRTGQLTSTLFVTFSPDSVAIQVDGKAEPIATPSGRLVQTANRSQFATLLPWGWAPYTPGPGAEVSGSLSFAGVSGQGPLRQHAVSVATMVRVVDGHGHLLGRSRIDGFGCSALLPCAAAEVRLQHVRRRTPATVQVFVAPSWWPEHWRISSSYPVTVVPVRAS